MGQTIVSELAYFEKKIIVIKKHIHFLYLIFWLTNSAYISATGQRVLLSAIILRLLIKYLTNALVYFTSIKTYSFLQSIKWT